MDIDKFVFSPPQISTAVTNSIEDARTDPTMLSLGLPALNEFVMARKDKVIGLLGDTSQGKTSLMSEIARNMSTQIDAEHGEIGIYVTWEDNMEDFGMGDIANFSKIPLVSLYNGQVKEHEFKKLMQAATERATTPLWIIGHSETSGMRPQLTMTDVCEAVEWIVAKQGRKVRFMCGDYLQRINRRDTNERDTRMQFSAIMDAWKNLALAYHPSVFVGSQVSRDKVEKHKWRQPQIHWAMETSNFEHTCDAALSVWMPSKSNDAWKMGDQLQDGITVTKELLLVEILKQKKGATQILKALDFLPEYSMFLPYGRGEAMRERLQREAVNNAI